MRVVAVAGAIGVGLAVTNTPGGVQLGWALQYGLLVAVSIVTSFWLPILGVNLALALAWLGASLRFRVVALGGARPLAAAANVALARMSPRIEWMNRQVGHVEAAATWVVIALVFTHRLAIQLGALAAVMLLGAPLIDAAIARTDFFGGAAARASHARLLKERRSLIYAATMLGLGILALAAPRQIRTLLPLLVAVVPGVLLRYGRFVATKRRRRRETIADEAGSPRAAAFSAAARHHWELEDQRDADRARGTGWFAPALIVVVFAAAVGGAAWQRHVLRRGLAATWDGPPPPDDACVPEPRGPVTPTLAMFVLADTQLHELGRKRFPGQMEIANALVPVCRRPVELDMLSTAAVVRFSSVYAALARDRAARGSSPLSWAHLGDFADLACTGEMERMVHLLEPLAPGAHLLAGVAPGNHDSTFQGNFDWSPYWSEACEHRLDKPGSDEALSRLLERDLSRDGRSEAVPAGLLAPLLHQAPAARFTLTRLGTLGGAPAGDARGVLGIFVDTSDRAARDFGIAGSFGTFSERQREQIVARVRAQRRAAPRGDPWADPWFVVFGHIPYDELTASSQHELAGLVATLDALAPACPPARDDCTRARVIALVAAHTHVAGAHRQCLGRRLVREIVVGSVIDPPEQASLIEIGLDERGRGALRLSTLPTIARPRMTCDTPAIAAATCEAIEERLARSPSCQDLVAGGAAGPPSARSCGALEAPLSLRAQIEGVTRTGGPEEPEALEAADGARARALLRCVCRADGGETPPPGCADALAQPLAGEAYAPVIEALARDPSRQEELTCLGWAAAALQRHKAGGMTFADALRCAFTDATLPPARVTVASATEVPCQ